MSKPKPLINAEFTWFVIARFLFIAGLRMTPFLLGWKLYEITGSQLSIGIVGLSEVIPAILLALYAGVKVDKSNKHRLISICMALYFLLMVGLLLVTSEWFTNEIASLGKSSAPQLTQLLIYGLVFFTGAVRAFSSPAINAFIAQLVWLTSSGDYRMLSIVQQDWQSLRNIVCVNTRKFKIYLTGCLVDQEIIP